MAETVAAVDSWLKGIGHLAQRADRFRDEAMRQADEKFRLRERINARETRIREARPKAQYGGASVHRREAVVVDSAV